MPKYVEHIKVGTDESWQIRDPDAQTDISNLKTDVAGIKRKTDNLDNNYAAKSHGHEYLPLVGGTLSGNLIRSGTSGMPVIQAERSDTGVHTSLAVDAEGVLHGLRTVDQWMLYANWNVIFLGNKPFVLSSEHCGETLPAAGTVGRIFLKKV